MKIISRDNSRYIISLGVGDEMLEELARFANKQGIKGASFSVIGALKELELAWYDVEAKQYKTRSWREGMEIANITGNISWMNEEVIVHAHGTFAGADCKAVAGHVKKAIIGAAGEVFIYKLPAPLGRKFDESLGLNILSDN